MRTSKSTGDFHGQFPYSFQTKLSLVLTNLSVGISLICLFPCDFLLSGIHNLRLAWNALRGWFRKFCHRCYNFVNIHDRLLYYTLIERATFLLYNDAKTMHEQNKYFEIHALKDTWGKTTGTFS